MVFNTFNNIYIVEVSFIGEGNRRKPGTCCKSLANFITWCCIEYALSWVGYELNFIGDMHR